MNIVESVLWRSVEWPGHESARLIEQDDSWLLQGAAAFGSEGRSCCLDYAITCSKTWSTQRARVHGWVGEQAIDIDIVVTPDQQWYLNGKLAESVSGCIDIDLNFSPSTNLLPIRRLDLGIGDEAPVRAAWLRFPSFALEPLDQIYARTDAAMYRYRSVASGFTAQLRVSPNGLVLDYEGLWERILTHP